MPTIGEGGVRPQLPARVRTYIDALLQACADRGTPLQSVVVFGSAAQGGFSGDVSDVDLIVVVPDGASRTMRDTLREDVARIETRQGLRSVLAAPAGRLRSRVERAVGHGFSCFVCTRSDVVSGDVARVLDLTSIEALFVDRIVLAGIIASAVSVAGEDLLSQVKVPPVRRLDRFKALFGFSSQVFLGALTFAVLLDATKYAMGALKHSLHSC